MTTPEYLINLITSLQERLYDSETNLQYISRLRALKRRLHEFSLSLTKEERENGEYAAAYVSYFHTCAGFSFYDRICMSIQAYEYGDKPF